MTKEKLISLRCKAWGITENEYYCNQCSDFSLEDMARAYRRGKNKGARDKAIQNVGFYQKQMQNIYDKKNKQIEIDAGHIRALQKQNGELTDKVNDLEDKLANADYQLEGRDNEIRELKEKIEKMKCCGNCKYYQFQNDAGYYTCTRDGKRNGKNYRSCEFNLEKWEGR